MCVAVVNNKLNNLFFNINVYTVDMETLFQAFPRALSHYIYCHWRQYSQQFIAIFHMELDNVSYDT